MPDKQKSFAANFSDFGGATNPSGIWSPAYIALKRALDHGADPDKVLTALYGWLSHPRKKSIKPADVDKILELSPEQAYATLVKLIGGGLEPGSLPAGVQETLKRVIMRLAHLYVERGRQAVAKETERLSVVQKRYESAQQVVQRLLAS